MEAWCGADWGSVHIFALRLCQKLQKSLAEWLWREEMGVCHGLVLSLSVPVAIKGRRTNHGTTTLCRALPDD